MQKSMQTHAAVFRDAPTLQAGADAIDEIVAKLPDVKITDRSMIWNTDMIETLELQVGTAKLIPASRNSNSHARADPLP